MRRNDGLAGGGGCHSAGTPPLPLEPLGRCFNRDGEGASAKAFSSGASLLKGLRKGEWGGAAE